MRALIPALAPLDHAARDRALAILPVPAARAFRNLPRADQSHALQVYLTVVETGERDPDLLVAALLHDSGKRPGVGITQRTARVLLARWPGLLQRIGQDRAPMRRWRRGMARHLHHARIGADLAASWGCTLRAVAVIRAWHDADVPDHIRRLQAADDRA